MVPFTVTTHAMLWPSFSSIVDMLCSRSTTLFGDVSAMYNSSTGTAALANVQVTNQGEDGRAEKHGMAGGQKTGRRRADGRQKTNEDG